MRRTGLVLLTVMALLAVTIIPAFAVTDGELDGEDHPAVGPDSHGGRWRTRVSL